MIRHTLFGLSLLALTSGVALASPAKHVDHSRTVAEATAPAGDPAAPTDGKAAKKEKKAKKEKAPKAEGKTEGAKEIKAAPTPAPAPAK
jgi:hypothetical protein